MRICRSYASLSWILCSAKEKVSLAVDGRGCVTKNVVKYKYNIQTRMILKGILANPLTFVVEMLQSASLSQKVGTGKKNHKYKNDTCIAHEWDR